MTRTYTMRAAALSMMFSGLVFAMACSVAAAAASTETLLHSFSRRPNGAYWRAGLVEDSAGNFYGSTTKGGSYGVVFRLSRNSQGQWVQTVLHNFTGGYNGPDGNDPAGGLLRDGAGNLYGTTQAGGALNCGISYELSPTTSGPWKDTMLHTFTCYPNDGARPSGGLIFDGSGDIYGVTAAGGSGGCNAGQGDPPFGWGTVFELTIAAHNTYNETILYNFPYSGSYESYPQGTLAFDASGNLYGTASSGGSGVCSFYGGGCGTVFKLSEGTSGYTESSIYNFTGQSDGDTPVSGVVFDFAGNLYATTAGYYNFGAVIQLSPSSSGSWTETSLYTFNSYYAQPNGAVAIDATGNLYGTTVGGGSPTACNNNGCGSIYKLSHGSSGWTETDLYDFTGGTDGAGPWATLLRDATGNLYTTTASGANGVGSIFKLAPVSGGTFTGKVLYDFTLLVEGTHSYAGLLADGAGNYYGTTSQGGLNINCDYYQGCGTVFKLSSAGSGWKETILYSFAGSNGDGAYPVGNMVQDSAGNLYGTRQFGGPSNFCSNGLDQCGTVYNLYPTGDGPRTETILPFFTRDPPRDGSIPPA